MGNQAAGWLAALAGLVLAMLLVGLTALLVRVLRLAGVVLRAPRNQARIALARLRGLRLTRLRALARHEGARTAAVTEEVNRLRAELRIVRAERDAARAELATLGPDRPARGWFARRAAAPDDRFQRAKRAFAMRFHPDRLSGDPRERALRIMLFREHWAELRRIERG